MLQRSLQGMRLSAVREEVAEAEGRAVESERSGELYERWRLTRRDKTSESKCESERVGVSAAVR